MSQEPEEEKVEPPMPDVPVDRQDTPAEAKASVDSPMEEAKLEMASKIEQGASPIDFSGDLEQKKASGVSSANIAAGCGVFRAFRRCNHHRKDDERYMEQTRLHERHHISVIRESRPE